MLIPGPSTAAADKKYPCGLNNLTPTYILFPITLFIVYCIHYFILLLTFQIPLTSHLKMALISNLHNIELNKGYIIIIIIICWVPIAILGYCLYHIGCIGFISIKIRKLIDCVRNVRHINANLPLSYEQ